MFSFFTNWVLEGKRLANAHSTWPSSDDRSSACRRLREHCRVLWSRPEASFWTSELASVDLGTRRKLCIIQARYSARLTIRLQNFFWVPLALYFGKRPVFIISCSLMFVSCIWAALARSFDSLLAATIVGSFGGASTETLVAATVNVRLMLSRHCLRQGHLQDA